MARITFGACPRCEGDLHHDIDIYGKYLTCLQCGYTLDQSESTEVYDRLVKPSKGTPDARPEQTHQALDDEMIDTSS